MRIAVYCSANSEISPVYFDTARLLGQWMSDNGHSLVFGGCDLGLMGTISQSVSQNGGHVTGVIPQILEQGGKAVRDLDVCIPCANLNDRKEIMIQHSDVGVALPGGIGTVDEIFSLVASRTLGYHEQTLLLYNVNGFWDGLIAMMDDLESKGVIRGDYRRYIKVIHDLEELAQTLEHL